VVGAIAAAAASCRPEFGERESLVDRTMVIAVRIEPAEAKPGEPVTASVLVASPNGPVVAPPTAFALCASPKPLTENGSIAAACQGDGVVQLAEGPGEIRAILPADACTTFGPETASAELRPRDPDVTGGFFQPIRARVAANDGALLTAFGFARITCNLGGAAAEVVARFRAEYRPNVSPRLLPVEARVAGELASLDAVPPGSRVVLRASWTAADAESYVAYDPSTSQLAVRRESMRVSWFTTAGGFASDRTGRSEEETETFSDNEWTAPSEARTTHLWVVLRDARGGTATTSLVARTR